MNAISWITSRLSEPSSHSAIGGLLGAAYVSGLVPPEYAEIVKYVGITFFGTAFVIPEKKSSQY